jgi:hypothetical protein
MHYLPIGNAEDWVALIENHSTLDSIRISLLTSQHGLAKD